MNTKLAQLEQRKKLLVARATAQRAELAGVLEQWQKPFHFLDRGVMLLRALGKHPLVAIGLTGLLLGSRWRQFSRLRSWTQRALVLFTTLRALRNSYLKARN